MLSDEELRHFAITLLTLETARDKQRRIGASNLSNPCDFCLASNLIGDMRETPTTSRAWGGRVLGTAVHGLLEDRLYELLTETEDRAARLSPAAQTIRLSHPDALVEHKMLLGELGTYGVVGSTADLVLPAERQVIDWKGTDDAKSAVLQDFLAIGRGEPAPYGRTHQVHKKKTLSEKAYAEKMLDMEFKVTGYFNQTQLYGLGLNRSGIPVDTASIVFISRDDTMWFDNPSENRYDDPTAMHGVWSMSFPYQEDYANAVWQRGLDIWAHLDAGGSPADFAHHPQCFPCGLDHEQALRDQRAAEAAKAVLETVVVDVSAPIAA